MRRHHLALLVLAGLTVAAPVAAQPGPFFGPQLTAPPPAEIRIRVSSPAHASLRSRFGVDMADHLLHSADADDRLRGIRRAAAVGSPEAVSLMVQAAGPGGPGRVDPRALIELARGLAPFASEEAVRERLSGMLSVAAPSGARDRNSELGARMGLARAIAALALARCDDVKCRDALAVAARTPGPGQLAAVAALAVRSASPLSDPKTALVGSGWTPLFVRSIAQSGDLRALDLLRAEASADPKDVDATSRAAALVALAQLGDERARPIAIARFADQAPRMRQAAGEALVLVDAPERFRAAESLIGNDDTVHTGVRLARRAQDKGVVKALAARFAVSSDPTLRAEILVALGRGLTPDALEVLTSLVGDPRWGSDAVAAIARSPNTGAMRALESLAAAPGRRRLVARAYAVRVETRGERSAVLDALVGALWRSRDARDRGVAAFARVLLGEADVGDLLKDPSPDVRRQAAMASAAHPTAAVQRALLTRATGEKDATTARVMLLALAGGDPDAIVPTLSLALRAESGGPDAPLAALALARRKGDAVKEKVDALLASEDPVLRAHTARGLAWSEEDDASGRLAAAYAYEGHAAVRRAIVAALAARTADARSPARADTLSLAARLDPDALTRTIARRALAGLPPLAGSPIHEIAWLRLVDADGSPPTRAMLGTYVTSEGLARPVVFDADGYALVPGVPPGEGRLVLAPSIP